MDVHVCVCARNLLLFKVALIFPKSNKSCVLHSHPTCRPGLARGTLGGGEATWGGSPGESTTVQEDPVPAGVPPTPSKRHSVPANRGTLQGPALPPRCPQARVWS